MIEDIKVIRGDGTTDDTEAFQHYVNGGKVVYPDGSGFPSKKGMGKFIEIKNPLDIPE